MPLLRWCRAMLWLCCCTAAATAVAGIEGQELWYPVSVDHQRTNYSVMLLRLPDGQLAVRWLDLRVLGLKVPTHSRFTHASEWFYPVNALDRHQVLVDEQGGHVHFVRSGSSHFPAPASADLLLTVTINGKHFPAQHFVYADGELAIPPHTLEVMGLVWGGDSTGPVPLHEFAGEFFSVDASSLDVSFTVPPERLSPQRIRAAASPAHGRAELSADSSSVVLGYRVAEGRNLDGEPWTRALAGVSVARGSSFCESHHLYQSGLDSTLRLDSRCVMDFPERLLSVTAGDSISGSAALAQPVRYGGIRIGTDFSLAPGLITQPTLSLGGSARVPSTLEVWVDQMLTLRTEIDPGPFELVDLAPHTGSGEVNAVVRNSLGDAVVISSSFYSDPSLLRPGLAQWSLEYGRERFDYLLPSDHYRDEGMVVGQARRGFSSWFTLGVHGEHNSRLDMAELDASIRVGQLGVVELAGAGSRDERGVPGRAFVTGFSRRSPRFSFGFRQSVTNDEFVQLGYEEPGAAPARMRQISVGIPLWRGASLSLGRVQRHYHDDTKQAFDTAALSLPLGGYASLLLSAFHANEPESSTFYGAHLTIPLGRRQTLSSSIAGRNLDERQVTLQATPPAGPGWGYRLSHAETPESEIDRGEVLLHGNYFDLGLHGERVDARSGGYAEIAGSVVATGRDLFLSRNAPGSFALVDVGAQDVRVYRDNLLVGTSDRHGRLLVPGLRPFENNRLHFAVEDLPLSRQPQMTSMTVVPGRRQAVAADFQVASVKRLSGQVMKTDGTPVPAGARVRLLVSGEEVMLGRNGLFYLETTEAARILAVAVWSEGRCVVDVSVPDTVDEFIELGVLTCRSN